MFRLFLIKPILGTSLKTIRQASSHTQNITSSEDLNQSYNFYLKFPFFKKMKVRIYGTLFYWP